MMMMMMMTEECARLPLDKRRK